MERTKGALSGDKGHAKICSGSTYPINVTVVMALVLGPGMLGLDLKAPCIGVAVRCGVNEVRSVYLIVGCMGGGGGGGTSEALHP